MTIYNKITSGEHGGTCTYGNHAAEEQVPPWALAQVGMTKVRSLPNRKGTGCAVPYGCERKRSCCSAEALRHSNAILSYLLLP
jgi:hypothetical protein